MRVKSSNGDCGDAPVDQAVNDIGTIDWQCVHRREVGCGPFS